ncbi:oligogalacturonate-specific porin KdgM family protein [Pantoea sp. B65]|uniref:oligogalacturonate-specific porin KdgM family protein n=1 Tax=Pantoea sp. B65 TaxID=2813359 RepID=UPI0039B50C58
MKKQTLLICGLLLSSLPAAAVTIDLRHEWLDDSKANKDRVLVSHRFDNGFGFSLETKWKSGGEHQDKPFNDVVGSGTESTISYQFKMSPEWFIQPGFTLESYNSGSIYKPYLTTGYNFKSGIYLNARYRYEYTRETEEGEDDEKVNRGEFWLGYRYQDLRFEYNYIYKSSDQIRFDNKKWDYEHNVRVLWNINQNWAPYTEVGNVSVRKTTDERQTRFRIGVQYSF